MNVLKYIAIFSLISFNSFAVNDFDVLAQPKQAPQVVMQNQYGEMLNLESFKGKVTILNFWATWCKPCIIEMPSMHMLQRKYKKNLNIIPIISQTESVSKVRTFLRRYKLRELEYYVDYQDFTKQAYKVTGIPTSFIFNKQGQLVASVDGAIDWMHPNNVKYIDQLIKQK